MLFRLFGAASAKSFLTFFITAIGLSGCSSTHSYMSMAVPVTNLRAQPNTTLQPGVQDSLQETQLLYGEKVRVIKKKDGWAFIEAVEQPEYTHAKRWQGYPGWVPLSSLAPWKELASPNIVITTKWADVYEDPYLVKPLKLKFPMGTQLHARNYEALWQTRLPNGRFVWLRKEAAQPIHSQRLLSVEAKRQALLDNAQKLLGDMYVWGGRSPQHTETASQLGGVDCSGLINLAYRTVGVDIPRDAHEQFLRAEPVKNLQPGDLIFLSKKDNPKRIVHVMLYAGEDTLIEGPGTGLNVRKISLKARLKKSIKQLTSGEVVEKQTVYFGSYLR